MNLDNNEKINFKFVNRNNDITIFGIHGINSSKNFVGNLKEYETEHNIFTYSYGDLKELKIQKIINLTKYIINKYFKNKKLIIVAHSFGAYISTKLFNNKNIIKYIFINPIHPLTLEYKPFLRLINSAEKRKKRVDFIENKQEFLKNKNSIKEIIEKRLKLYDILIEINNNKNKLKKEFVDLTNKKEKTIFIVSANDFIISSKLLQQFLHQNKINPKIIKHTGHSPLMKETKRTYNLFKT